MGYPPPHPAGDAPLDGIVQLAFHNQVCNATCHAGWSGCHSKPPKKPSSIQMGLYPWSRTKRKAVA